MNLSILIPTYRFDCTPLVDRLLVQLPDDVEIVVGDDDSPNAEDFLSELEGRPHVRVVRQRPNRGSAAMRNRLAREAKGEYLLYMDCDGMPLADDFLERYMRHLPTEGVVCGNVRHPEAMPSPQVSLRWTYEKQAERLFTPQRCNQQPYRSFRTFHFLVPKAVMMACPFDEEIKLSGYEDVLLGRRLQEMGIKVLHIDNPVLNLDIEPNERFLEKTEQQLRTLCQKRALLEGYSSLLACYERFERMHLTLFLRLWHGTMQRFERKLLQRKRPSIRLFQLYKLGYFARIAKQKC